MRIGSDTRYHVGTHAGARATAWALVGGAFTTAVVGFSFGIVDGSAVMAVLVAGASGIVAGMLLKWGMTPPPERHRRRPPRGPFATTAQLRDGRVRLLVARNEHAAHLREKLDLRQRLVNLRDRMQELGLPAYLPRIASVENGLRTIDRQLEIIARLRDGYDRSIRMIDIELDAGAAADAWSEDVGPQIVAAIRELKALEASQAELALQLEANVEVEQLLSARVTA